MLHTQVSHARDPERVTDYIGDFRILITLKAFKRQHRWVYCN